LNGVAPSASAAIGQTPLVGLSRITADIEPDDYLVITPRDAIDCALPGATVPVIACDSGLKYLSTDLWASPDSVADRQTTL
jgi:hypothetical protein